MSFFDRSFGRRVSLASLVAFLVGPFLVSGCESTKKKPPKEDDEQGVLIVSHSFDGDALYTGIPWDDILSKGESYISDNDVHFDSKEDAENVAHWVKQRRDALRWCGGQTRVLNPGAGPNAQQTEYKRVWPDDPKKPETRLDQMIAIASRVLESVHDDSPERYWLAKALFSIGSAEWWNWDHGLMLIFNAKDKGKPVDPTWQPDADKHFKKMVAYHLAAKSQFDRLMADMPMWKGGAFYMWCIEFQLGNFERAKAWINQILEMPDLARDARTEFEEIRKRINEYLVDRQLDPNTPKPFAPDWNPERRGNVIPPR